MATLSQISLEHGLPASVEAERTILGAILLDNAAYSEAAERLIADDFSLDSHRRIYARMGELIDANRAVDIITLSEELDRQKELESIGNRAYIFSLTENLPRRLSIEDYVRIVKDKSILRQMMGICSTAQARAADQSEDALEVLNATETALLEVSERGITQGFSSIPEIVKGSFGSIDNLYKEGREITGLATHYHEFDRMTSGLQPSELIIIAARPSMGKTAWAINIAENAAVRDGKVVGVFSLEMSKEALLRRMLASQSMVNMRHIQTGFLTRDDRDKLVERSGASGRGEGLYRRYSGHFAGRDACQSTPIASAGRRQLDLIVIDYLQLMSASSGGPNGRRPENRTQEVSTISRGLKALAKEMRVPVIALSQLSRASEQRGGDKKPMLSDLRESGSIEQDADVVAFIHRDSYYNRDERRRRRSRIEEPGGDHHREATQWPHRSRPSDVHARVHSIRKSLQG